MKLLKKTPTGIAGLDEILDGGLPKGRPTLISGGPGCGKTLLGMEFLCRGASEFAEPGLFVTFEETREDIEQNFASSTFGFEEALKKKHLEILSFPMPSSLETETGDFTFDGFLIRIEHTLQAIGAKRMVIDSLRALFARFTETPNLRHEYGRIFQWIKQQDVSAIVTTQNPEHAFTLHELEEYLSDCVIYMDHRISDQISKRRLRVGKYRGASHGTDEYPFILTSDGVSILPISSLSLESAAPSIRVSTGVKGLDEMLAGKGFYQGSSVLVSGGAGTGKSTLAACFARETCRSGDRVIYLAFEESKEQILRNMRSVGIDFAPYLDQGNLLVEPIRPGRFGLEEHLVRVHKVIARYQPRAVIIDPITSFTSIGSRTEIKSMLTRLLDYIKSQGVATFMTSLTPGGGIVEESETEISSIVDVWVVVRFERREKLRRRHLYVLKARGIAHSHEMSELILSDAGAEVMPFDEPARGAQEANHGRH